jgi:hypothetical protein
LALVRNGKARQAKGFSFLTSLLTRWRSAVRARTGLPYFQSLPETVPRPSFCFVSFCGWKRSPSSGLVTFLVAAWQFSVVQTPLGGSRCPSDDGTCMSVSTRESTRMPAEFDGKRVSAPYNRIGLKAGTDGPKLQAAPGNPKRIAPASEFKNSGL